ncbi:MAG: GNAT family N-acetyltransferase, partial [Pseudomonadota bacterium]
MQSCLRPAEPRDAPAIAEIYGWHVLHGTGTFEEVPPAAPEMAERM